MSFDVLIGQDAVVKKFQTALARDKLAHTYLIVGPEGVGKRTFAKEAARALLCKKGGTDACNVCTSCRRIPTDKGFRKDSRPKRGRSRKEDDNRPDAKHPDFHWIEPVATGGSTSDEDSSGRNIVLEQALDLQSKMQFKPFESRYKVAVVAECEMLTDEAANSLLKFLEEPPPATIMFLTTSRPDSVLGTIVSRCQFIRMTALETRDVAAILKTRCGIDEARAERLAEASDGSVSRALWIGSEQGRNLRLLALDIIRQGPGLDEEEAATQVARRCTEMGSAEGVTGKKRLREYVRRKAKDVLAFVASFFTDICRFHTTGKVTEAAEEDWKEAIGKWAGEFNCDEALQAVRFALEAAAYIDQNVDVELVLGDFFRRSLKRRSRLPA